MQNKIQSVEAETVSSDPGRHLSLQLTPRAVPLFYQLLGQGFRIGIRTGFTVKNLLCDQLGIHEDYLARRIQTIFLNGKVVDDIKTAVVNEGSTMALSGAMPGLVGAILRSGGHLAAMRNQISHGEKIAPSRAQSVNITLKLMNIVVRELGVQFLQRGIWLKSKDLQEFFGRHLDELKPGWIAGELDGQPIEAVGLDKIDWVADWILLQVKSEARG